MKPIETEYAGYRFRSRLEARWAVFFDTADLEYRYEPEGFVLPWALTPEWNESRRFRYLPDFQIPSIGGWGEVKAEWSAQEKRKVFNAAFAINRPILILPDIFRQPRGGSRRPYQMKVSKNDLTAAPWPPMAGDTEETVFSNGALSPLDLLRGHQSDTPAPDWYVTAARAAQRARFEFGQTPGRPTL